MLDAFLFYKIFLTGKLETIIPTNFCCISIPNLQFLVPT